MEGAERWKGKVALVTGATSGIGKAIAEALGAMGMRVAVAGRTRERLVELVQGLEARGAEGLAAPVDLRSEEDIQGMFRAVHERFGPLDVLINNAGLAYNGTMADAPTADWKEVLDVNVLALSICMREALKDMDGKQDAAIINISSLSGHRVPPGNRSTFYAASKHAVRAITEGMRTELVAGKSKVKLGMISPGMVKTEFQARSKRAADKSGFVATYRVLDPEDIAQAAVFMLSTPRHVQIHDIVIRPVEQPH
jgi:NADP-dependent 3-hydroxy acid dehydrogenase YdfG